MSELGERFRKFFEDLHGYRPFPWQERLTERVCTQGWPEVIALPTGSGKTACLDIAVFALAHCDEGTAPRRILYVVDRRLVVSEAYQRMIKIRTALKGRRTEMLRWVGTELLKRAHADAEEPLEACEMRGGAYRDESWVRTPLQPVLVSSTVDQVGSRLLFRGYGVSDSLAPIHASLVANDALILLDEAHAARAFAQTLAAVNDYRTAGREEMNHLPLFQFVEMTATPCRQAAVDETFSLDDNDRAYEELGRRLRAPKPVGLEAINAKKDDFRRLAEQLVEKAEAQAEVAGAKRVAILCNRVHTARLAYRQLLQAGRDTLLVTGRMRPLDRDDLYRNHLRALKSGEPRGERTAPLFVVATQSLEVGADLDFDVLVSEIASLDAILQRFGRLNRMGKFDAARGVIVCASWHREAKNPDPVYGETIGRTWEWLSHSAVDGRVQLGLESSESATIPMLASQLGREDRERMTRLGPSAPVLLPAHLDALVQTSPRPEPEPDISLFLHGAEPVRAEAQIVWRADLTDENKGTWNALVEFCPPVSTEALPAGLGPLRRWLAGQAPSDTLDADVEGACEGDNALDTDGATRQFEGVLWRNGKADTLDAAGLAARLKPGDTVVLPIEDGTSPPDALGHIPEGAARDLGDRAHWQMQRRVTLRILREVIEASGWPPCSFKNSAIKAAAVADTDTIKNTLSKPGEIPDGWLKEFVHEYAKLKRPQFTAYPSGGAGVLFEARRAHGSQDASKPVTLAAHLDDVRTCAKRLTERTLPSSEASAVVDGAWRHDWGKVDPRFQALLRGGDTLAGRFAPILLAKSGSDARGKNYADLPKGFRHELLSYLLADRELSPDHPERDLVLHLIASHHGHCRPFAPVVPDPQPCGVRWDGTRITGDEIRSRPAHHLSHGIAERFWQLTRRFGWWGLAYLETMLRLADWEASATECSEVSDE